MMAPSDSVSNEMLQADVENLSSKDIQAPSSPSVEKLRSPCVSSLSPIFAWASMGLLVGPLEGSFWSTKKR